MAIKDKNGCYHDEKNGQFVSKTNNSSSITVKDAQKHFNGSNALFLRWLFRKIKNIYFTLNIFFKNPLTNAFLYGIIFVVSLKEFNCKAWRVYQ